MAVQEMAERNAMQMANQCQIYRSRSVFRAARVRRSSASMTSVTGADLAYDDTGEGPVVVFLHGHPFNRTMWAPQLAAFRDRYRVIVPDLRGYGESPVTPGTVTMAELAADVRHLLDREGIGPTALVGLSMGGLILMELAAAQPDRWWALGFIATTARPTSPAEVADRLARAQLAEEQGMRPLAEDMAAHLFGPAPAETLTRQIMDMMLATNPLGAAAALRGRAQRPDYRPMLASLRTSSLVCVGHRRARELPAQSAGGGHAGHRAPAQPGAHRRLQRAPGRLPGPGRGITR
jgi:3-oxoadipate enol-lactonase